jgi:hypothetical protein
MSRRSVEDALRSVKRYTSEVLGDQWEVRLWADRGEFSYPLATVAAVAAPILTGPASYHYEVVQPMSINCYEAESASPTEGLLAAESLIEKLLRGFRGPGVGLGRPLRIPLFDYTGVGIEDWAAQRHPSDFLRVVEFSPRPLPDALEPKLVSVTVDMRVSWRRDLNLHEVINRRGWPTKGDIPVEEVRVVFHEDEDP